MPGAARFSAVPAAVIAVPGTNVETSVLQVGLDSSHIARITEIGVSFDSTTANVPVLVFLRASTTIITGGSVASVTMVNTDPGSALVASGYGLSASAGPASYLGVITGTNVGLARGWLISPTSGLGPIQWPQDREPIIRASTFYEITVAAPNAVNCMPYFEVEV